MCTAALMPRVTPSYLAPRVRPLPMIHMIPLMQQAANSPGPRLKPTQPQLRAFRSVTVACASRGSDTHDHRQQQAFEWSKARGAAMYKLSVRSCSGSGKAVLVSAKDIQVDDTIFKVNHSKWLLSTIKESSLGLVVDGLEPWLQLALYLMHVRHANSSGDCPPYLASMPNLVSNPLSWTDSQLQLLQGTQLLKEIQDQKAFLSRQYAELFGKDGKLAGNTTLFPPAAYTYDKFVAAVASLNARTLLDGDPTSLSPLPDMVSHRRNANSAWKAGKTGLFRQGQALVVEATQLIKQGEEITMDYGPGLPDNAVLIDYGVIDTSHPQPGFTIYLSLDPSDPLLQDKTEFMEKELGLTEPVGFVLSPGVPPPAAMMGFLRLRELKGMDVFLLKPLKPLFGKSDKWNIKYEPGSLNNERAVCSRMAKVLQDIMSGYPSTTAADVALLASGSLRPGSPEEAAVQIRLGELQSLGSTAGWFKSRAAQLSQLDYYQTRWQRNLGLSDHGSGSNRRKPSTTSGRSLDDEVTVVKATLTGTLEREVPFQTNTGTATYCAPFALLLLSAAITFDIEYFYLAGLSSSVVCVAVILSSPLTRMNKDALLWECWMNLLEIRRLQGKPWQFLQDADEVLSVGWAEAIVHPHRAEVVAGIAIATMYSLLLYGVYSVVDEATFWKEYTPYVTCLVFCWGYVPYAVFKEISARGPVRVFEERHHELRLAMKNKGRPQSLSEPVKVGLRESSMPLSVYKYLFRGW